MGKNVKTYCEVLYSNACLSEIAFLVSSPSKPVYLLVPAFLGGIRQAREPLSCLKRVTMRAATSCFVPGTNTASASPFAMCYPRFRLSSLFQTFPKLHQKGAAATRPHAPPPGMTSPKRLMEDLVLAQTRDSVYNLGGARRANTIQLEKKNRRRREASLYCLAIIVLKGETAGSLRFCHSGFCLETMDTRVQSVLARKAYMYSRHCSASTQTLLTFRGT